MSAQLFDRVQAEMVERIGALILRNGEIGAEMVASRSRQRELEAIHQRLVGSLQEEIGRLEAEEARLRGELLSLAQRSIGDAEHASAIASLQAVERARVQAAHEQGRQEGIALRKQGASRVLYRVGQHRVVQEAFRRAIPNACPGCKTLFAGIK